MVVGTVSIRHESACCQLRIHGHVVFRETPRCDVRKSGSQTITAVAQDSAVRYTTQPLKAGCDRVGVRKKHQSTGSTYGGDTRRTVAEQSPSYGVEVAVGERSPGCGIPAKMGGTVLHHRISGAAFLPEAGYRRTCWL